MVKVIRIHISYFIALIFFSFLSFFVLFGAGFVGKLNTIVLLIPFFLSVGWLSDYTWRILSTNPEKKQLFRPTKSWAFIRLFLSGIFTVYSLFLTTLLPTPYESAPLWMFLGTSVIMLLFWYWLLYRYIKNKRNYVQHLLGSILFVISLLYAYQVFGYFVENT